MAMRFLAVIMLLSLLAGCGGGASGATTAPAAPAKASEGPASARQKPAAETKSAVEVKPAAEAKPAVEVSPATQAKPAGDPPAVAPVRLTMGSSNPESSTYAYSVALAKLLQSAAPGLNVTVSSGGGLATNAKNLSEGKIDFSIFGSVGLHPIYSGENPAWKDNPLKDARVLWIYDQAVHLWFVREDSGVTSLAQLDGKDFNGGGQGTSTEYLVRNLAFPALGITPKWYAGGSGDVLAAVKDRRIVGMGKSSAVGAIDPVIQDAMTTTKIRILSWPPEQVQTVKGKYAFLRTTEIAAGTYQAPWNEKAIVSWGDGFGIFTLAKFPENLAYTFTKAAVEDNKKGASGVQASAYPAVKNFDMAESTVTLSPVPLHAGAYRYYREIGAKLSDDLRPPEVK